MSIETLLSERRKKNNIEQFNKERLVLSYLDSEDLDLLIGSEEGDTRPVPIGELLTFMRRNKLSAEMTEVELKAVLTQLMLNGTVEEPKPGQYIANRERQLIRDIVKDDISGLLGKQKKLG